MKVNEILIGLEHDNYVWTAKNPRQTLYVRIGKLAGVRKSEEGLYVAEGVASTGIVPEVVSSFDGPASESSVTFGTSAVAEVPSEPASF